MLREANLRRLAEESFDVLVVGGGVNGAVAAAALAARGARTALLERGDFAGETSQASSNLAWGGVKYLESFEVALVRKLCRARNELLRTYPSTVQEIRFLLVHERGFRHSRAGIWAGTWLYWALGRFATRRPRLLSRAELEREEPAVDAARADGAVEYSDAYLHDNDARFTWGFVRSALDRGAAVANYVESLGASREGGAWVTRARDLDGGRELLVRSRLVVNACGPFADAYNALIGQRTRHRHVLSKGIHLLVDRLTPHRRVIAFFADDGRLFFVIPMGPKTCLGTTDTPTDSPEVRVTPEDRRFVLDNVNRRLRLPRPLGEDDVVAERCGVRPLAVEGEGAGGADWMQLSRRHVVEADPSSGVLTVFGGKLTDCLNVGEEVCAEVERMGVALPDRRRAWYGEPPAEVRDEYFLQARRIGLDAMTSPASSEPLSTRLWRRYGARALGLLDAIRADPAEAQVLIENAEYLRCELELAARREMVVRLEDFLRRRSKISQVVRREDVRDAQGLREACRLLFGERAQERLLECFPELRGAEEAGWERRRVQGATAAVPDPK
ncbi:MAG TPA: FAD-dependent oxidoreductase [Anaeromyxobacteraceae bacterium]